MVVTEEQAKTKRCQETFASLGAFSSNGSVVPVINTYNHGVSGQGLPIHPAPTHCIGSACMAWRVSTRSAGQDLGYCGKAGKP